MGAHSSPPLTSTHIPTLPLIYKPQKCLLETTAEGENVAGSVTAAETIENVPDVEAHHPEGMVTGNETVTEHGIEIGIRMLHLSGGLVGLGLGVLKEVGIEEVSWL